MKVFQLFTAIIVVLRAAPILGSEILNMLIRRIDELGADEKHRQVAVGRPPRSRALKGSKGCQNLQFYVLLADIDDNFIYDGFISAGVEVDLYSPRKVKPVGTYTLSVQFTAPPFSGIATGIISLSPFNVISFTSFTGSVPTQITGGSGVYECASGSTLETINFMTNKTMIEINTCNKC